jgi:peptidoglycan hydrolase CwlO-like protein
MEAGAIRQALTDVRNEVSDLRDEVRGVGAREQDTRERTAVLKTRVDRLELDLAELKRRPTIGPLTH